MIATAIPAWANVEVTVTRVGFAEIGEGDFVRVGAWSPILVDLDLVNQPAFDGVVRAAQLDTDGDRAFDQVPVHLRAESGGRRAILFLVPNPVRGEPHFWVEVLDEDGEAVEVVSQGQLTFRAEPAQQPRLVESDDVVILSISQGSAGRVQDLTDEKLKDAHQRPVRVAHSSVSDLPELWVGLEGIDGVVWDDARPEDLTDRQLSALLDWVRFGGRLLIAASKTSGSVKLDEALRSALPVDVGEVEQVNNLPHTREKLLGTPEEASDLPTGAAARENSDWFLKPLPQPIEVVSMTPRPGSSVLLTESSTSRPILVERRVGRGSIVFFGTTLREFFSGEGTTPPFFEFVFDLQPQRSSNPVGYQARSLYDHVVSATAFARSASAYLLAAFLFSGVYLAVATGGVWWFLGRRGWRRHSWSAFALLAVAASGLSVVAVKQVHGFGDALHQVSVIDFDAGERVGSAMSFFGLKTGSDRVADVWMPPDAISATEPAGTTAFLRPLPAGGRAMDVTTTFADPQGYELRPGNAAVEGVRVRSTLKRFEGRTETALGGSVTANIVIRGQRIDEGSTIRNDLGVDLKDCYLLQPARPARESAGARDNGIYAYFLGDLAGDGSTIALGPRLAPPRPSGVAPGQPLRRPTLRDRQQEWTTPFRGLLSGGFGADQNSALILGQERSALLLASTIGDLDPATVASAVDHLAGPWTWSRDRLRQLDLRSQLEPGSVMLLGFANEAGPVRLFRRTGDRPYRALAPDRAWTMYRVRIPATRLPASALDADESMLGDSED